jgi:pSer/pThr/pTyr-binding forkhead associated (FHA) protein
MDSNLQEQTEKIPDNIFLVIDKHLLPIKKNLVKIGRHPDNDLIINDPRISRFHAQVRFEDGQFMVYDMDAKFGTYVNSELIEKCVVVSGDTISLANTPLLFINRSSDMIRNIRDTTGMLSEE